MAYGTIQFRKCLAAYHFKCRLEGVDLETTIQKYTEQVDYFMFALTFTGRIGFSMMGALRFIDFSI